VSALAVYMTQYQLLPYQRTAEVLNELAGLGISPSTIQRAVRVVATRLEAPVASYRCSRRTRHGASDPCRRGQPRVNDTLHGLPVLSTKRLTAYFPPPLLTSQLTANNPTILSTRSS